MSTQTVTLPISAIRTDGGTQMRAGLNEVAIHDYLIDMIQAGGWGSFPPVTVYHDGQDHWLADGFHRLAAYRLIATPRDADGPIPCAPAIVLAGTQRDAVLHAAGANASHGLRRSNADKRRAVLTLLSDPEWARWSDREIARRCRVDHGTVAELRRANHTGEIASMERVFIHHRTGEPAIMRFDGLAHNTIYEQEQNGGGAGAGMARCRRCKRPLTDPASIAAGIGPCCRTAGFGGDEGDEEGEEEDRRVYEFRTPENAQEAQNDERSINEPTEAENEAGRRPHVAQASGDNEWYTPAEIIERARRVMGGIDLDPASSEVANLTVRAGRFYSQEDNGLIHEWRGRVWMNPPYSSDLIGRFAARLVAAVEAGAVTQAVVLVNNATETGWFRQLMRVCSVVCFPTGRISFFKADGGRGAPLQGQAIIYAGANVIEFAREFGRMGQCLIRMEAQE